MTSFNINYGINGTSYPVLNDNTVSVSYDLSVGTLSTALQIESPTNLNSALAALSDGDSNVTITLTILDENEAVVDTLQAEVVSVISTSITYIGELGARLGLAFEISVS